MRESVVIYHAGTPTGAFDEMQNPILGDPVAETVVTLGIAPTAGDESPDKSVAGAINGYTLYLPFGTVVGPNDMVTIRGVDGWHVDSDATAAAWASPFTSWTPGTVAIVRKAS